MKTLLQLYRDNAGCEKRPVNAVRNAAGNEATIYIYGIISADWGIGAIDVIAAIASVGDVEVLNVRITTPGGDVFESRAIMNAIKRFAGKTVGHIDGLCASAGTSVAMACGTVEMASDAMYMIHNVQGGAFGDKSDLRETADLMETVEQTIVGDYTAKTGKSAKEIVAMMEAETWLTAAQALESGFIDSVADNKSTASNTWNLAAYPKAPAALVMPELAAPALAAAPVVALAPVVTEPAAEPEPVIPAPCMRQANANRLALAQSL